MTFLYSSLSILFLSGILLISKHATLFANRNPIDYLENSYSSSKYQIIDRYILNLFKNSELNSNGVELCYILKEKLSSSGYIDSQDSEYFVFNKTSSLHPLLIDSCILSDGNHRILVKTNPSNQKLYNLNSCLVYKQYMCSFEKD
tara:strand:- start:245 stop:679 length:435 start_codon:yes stop_codon:yes gene_type:complete